MKSLSPDYKKDLLREIEGLPPEKIKEVLDFIKAKDVRYISGQLNGKRWRGKPPKTKEAGNIIKEKYKIIEKDILKIVQEIKKKDSTHVSDYDWLFDRLHQTDVSTDMEYQKTYKNYWRMNRRALPDEWFKKYFEILEEAKYCEKAKYCEVDISKICLDLYNIKNTRGEKSLQFSFATKLAHMIDNNSPIYDNFIRSFYQLSFPSRNKKK
ncbi:MAG: hypothetical protein AB1611_16380 [bacterium]